MGGTSLFLLFVELWWKVSGSSPLLSLRLMLSSCLKKGVVIGSVSIYFSVMFMVEFIFRELQIQSVYIFRHGDD